MTAPDPQLTRRGLFAAATAAAGVTVLTWTDKLLAPHTPLERYRDIDQKLTGLSSQISFATYVKPLGVKQQRDQFLHSPDHTPKFFYKDVPSSLEKVLSEVRSVEIPDDILPFQKLLQSFQTRLELQLTLLQGRRDPDHVKEYSQLLYGRPTDALLETANRLLDKIPIPYEPPATLRASDARKRFRERIAAENLIGWRIREHEQERMSIRPKTMVVNIPSSRMFSDDELAMRLEHEFSHIYRASNAARSPIRSLRYGLHRYSTTEEGLACYAELQRSKFPDASLRRYAGRVVAVFSSLRGDTFPQTFTALRDRRNGFTDKQAWELAYGVHRYGGLLRDHIYLQGLQQVQTHLEAGGSLRPLYVGKIAIEHLPFVEELVALGFIEPQHYIPRHLA